MSIKRVIEKLDVYIRFWKKKKDEHAHHDDLSTYYIDAFETAKELLEQDIQNDSIMEMDT